MFLACMLRYITLGMYVRSYVCTYVIIMGFRMEGRGGGELPPPPPPENQKFKMITWKIQNE